MHGVVQAVTLGPSEQNWVDAHPVVRFSIHEKYAPYLRSGKDLQEMGVFRALISQLSERTQQEFIPIWRKTDQEGLQQLINGEVDFIIDPPARCAIPRIWCSLGSNLLGSRCRSDTSFQG
jgi:two-component system, NarL family, sensor histidine kinase EvgS